MTLWERLVHSPQAKFSEDELGLSLQQVHQAMEQSGVELPHFLLWLTQAHTALDDNQLMPHCQSKTWRSFGIPSTCCFPSSSVDRSRNNPCMASHMVETGLPPHWVFDGSTLRMFAAALSNGISYSYPRGLELHSARSIQSCCLCSLY